MLIQFSQNVTKRSIAARRPNVLIITLIVLRDAARLHVKSERCSTCRLGPAAAALHYSCALAGALFHAADDVDLYRIIHCGPRGRALKESPKVREVNAPT